VRGASHDVVQVEPLQTCPLGHAAPHDPQFALSFVGFTQDMDAPVPHTMFGEPHVI
jgi:hypothetical protein